MCCVGIWKFNVHDCVRYIVLFELMVEGWLRDSGPINLFLEQIGTSIRRSHENDKLCCECSTMTRLKRFYNKY